MQGELFSLPVMYVNFYPVYSTVPVPGRVPTGSYPGQVPLAGELQVAQGERYEIRYEIRVSVEELQLFSTLKYPPMYFRSRQKYWVGKLWPREPESAIV